MKITKTDNLFIVENDECSLTFHLNREDSMPKSLTISSFCAHDSFHRTKRFSSGLFNRPRDVVSSTAMKTFLQYGFGEDLFDLAKLLKLKHSQFNQMCDKLLRWMGTPAVETILDQVLVRSISDEELESYLLGGLEAHERGCWLPIGFSDDDWDVWNRLYAESCNAEEFITGVLRKRRSEMAGVMV